MYFVSVPSQGWPKGIDWKGIEKVHRKGIRMQSEECQRALCLLWLEAFLCELEAVERAEQMALPEALFCFTRLKEPTRKVFEREIYTYAWHRLLRYACSPARGYRLGDRAQEFVSEACQEGTIKFVDRLGKRWPEVDFPSFVHLRAYFFAVVRNALVDMIRKRHREALAQERRERNTLLKELQKAEPDWELSDWDGLQEAVLRWSEELSREERVLLIGRFFSTPERSYPEIAQELNETREEGVRAFTAGQLRVRKHRLIRHLARWLKEESEGVLAPVALQVHTTLEHAKG